LFSKYSSVLIIDLNTRVVKILMNNIDFILKDNITIWIEFSNQIKFIKFREKQFFFLIIKFLNIIIFKLENIKKQYNKLLKMESEIKKTSKKEVD
jgi:hypothetical protein